MKDLNWLVEQIEAEVKYVHMAGDIYTVPREDILSLIGQVNCIRKTEVPDFVDLWIRSNSSMGWWRKIAQWEDDIPEEDREVYNWYQNYNEDAFIIAWITKEYTVIKEKLYFAKLKDIDFPKSSTAKNLSRSYYWVVEEVLDSDEEGVSIYPTPGKTMAGVFKKREWNKMGINDSNADFIKFVGGSDD